MKKLTGVIVALIFVMLAFLPVVDNHTTVNTNNVSNARNDVTDNFVEPVYKNNNLDSNITNFNNRELQLNYSIKTKGSEYFIHSNVYLLNHTYVNVYTWINKSYEGKYKLPLHDFLFKLPSDKLNIQKIDNVTLYITRNAEFNKYGFISYSSIKLASNTNLLNYNLKIVLNSISGNQLNAFENLRKNNTYYFFIPEFISSITNINNYNTNQLNLVHPDRLPIEVYHKGALNLTEEDNTIAHLRVFYIQTDLNVRTFNNNGWKACDIASAISSNWMMISHSIKSEINPQKTEVTATSGAEFYGVFPLGTLDFWYAYPTVTVHVFSSGSVSGYINDPIYTSGPSNPIILWSNNQVKINQIDGYKCVLEDIIN